MRRPGGGDRFGEAGTGDEAHLVAAGDEVPGDGEERRDVAVDRHAGDDDRGHGSRPPAIPSCTDGFDYDGVLFTTMATAVN